MTKGKAAKHQAWLDYKLRERREREASECEAEREAKREAKRQRRKEAKRTQHVRLRKKR